MSSDGSDIEMQSALPKKAVKKQPKSPSDELLKSKEEKRITTKDMIQQALIDLKSRKGTSLYAIKKYLEDKYKIDVERKKYIIKKYLVTSVEAGIIVQTKGVGASGSFKLAPGKDKPEKKKKKVKKTTEKPTKGAEKNKDNSEKEDKPKKTKAEKKGGEKQKKKVEISKEAKVDEKETKDDKTQPKTKKPKVSKMAKGMQTPAKKKAAMMKRKSIGSIIKPPKMKPK